MYGLLVFVAGFFASAFVLLVVVYSKLMGNFKRVHHERDDLLDKYLKAHYRTCSLIRTLDRDYRNLVSILGETIPILDDDDLKISMGELRDQFLKIQKTILEKEVEASEEFMADYEIHQLVHGE